jgi:hypothetical protein
MTRRTIILRGQSQRDFAKGLIDKAPVGYTVTIAEETRRAAQNRLLWPLLARISDDVIWYGNHLSKEEWKDVLTASLRGTKVVPGVDGGFVTVGLQTHKMGVREFSELIELIFAFGVEHGIEWPADYEVTR